MATEEGIVQRVANTTAFVQIQRYSACAGCHSESQCRPSEKKEMVVEALNDVQAREGDRVRISLATESLMKVTFLVYFVPLLALIFGAALGGHLAPTLGVDSTLASIGFGALAMGAIFLIIRRFDRGAQKKAQYWPRITQILSADYRPDFACSKSDRT